ncbi:hypothetical protein ABGT22_04095 [Peribacillus frigoritolerans]
MIEIGIGIGTATAIATAIVAEGIVAISSAVDSITVGGKLI